MKLECHEIEEFTGAYLADQLTVQERFRMEMHLNECSSCSSELAELAELAAILKQGFDAEDQEPELSPSHRENLRVAWGKADPSLYHYRSARRMARKAVALLATAASIMLASYFSFVSGQQQIQQSSEPIQVATIPFTMTPAAITAWSSYNGKESSSSARALYDEIMRIASAELPEYGIGMTAMTSQPRVSTYVGGLPVPQPGYSIESYVPNQVSYAGLPVPSPKYDTGNRVYGYK